MDKVAFEAELVRDGFVEIASRELPADFGNAEHFHGWDLALLVLQGEFRLSRDGAVERIGPGQSCMVKAGMLHADGAGPDGASFVVGRRY